MKQTLFISKNWDTIFSKDRLHKKQMNWLRGGDGEGGGQGDQGSGDNPLKQ